MGLKPVKLISVPEVRAKTWINKGEAHKNLQQYSEALESFNKALEFNQDSEEAQKNKDEVLGMING
jgi:tetratricopeptide (TPR) repeat protein